jgi:ribose-phosphate pyrophosphokinase
MTAGAVVAALTESRHLGTAVAREAGLPLLRVEERGFEDGEFKLRALESVRGRTVFVLQSLAGTASAPVCERLIRLLFLLQGLSDGGASATIALLPYLAFARKERRTQPRDPVTSRYLAQLLEAAHIACVIAVDAHNPAALDNAFRVPTVHLTALPMMVEHFAAGSAVRPLTVVSPDTGGIKRAQIFQERLAAVTGHAIDLAFITKRRAQDVVSGGRLAGEVAGRAVIVLDDLCATGGTLIRAAHACRRAGAESVRVAVTHVPLPGGLDALVEAAEIDGIVVTDSVGRELPMSSAAAGSSKLVTLPIAPLLGETVRRLSADEPLAPLLARWPPQAQE